MNGTDPSELAVRGAALYLPIAAVIGLAWWRRPSRRLVGAALVATAWNLPAILALNLVAVRVGWWQFHADSATVLGIPADLWIGWSLLWGALPVLATTRRPVTMIATLTFLDLVVMGRAEPVLHLSGTWLVGEAGGLALCLVPGWYLGRWTAQDIRLRERATLQMVAFTGLLLFVLPSVVLELTGGSWTPLLARPRFHFILAALAVAPFAAMAIQAVHELVERGGGTPVPLDPPTAFVGSGPYAYLANPMQLGATVILAGWGVLLASPAVIAAGVGAAIFSAGLAWFSEDQDLKARFPVEWPAYRSHVRTWWPSWRPADDEPATVYVAAGCDPCREVGGFLARRRTHGLTIAAAEDSSVPLERITYTAGGRTASGIAGLARSLERVNLAWAAAGWTARLPIIQPLLQLVADAVGAGPRSVAPGEQVDLDPAPTSR